MTEKNDAGVVETWAGGRVRRAPAGRHRVVYVRVTEEELGELRRRASLAGVSPPRYLLEQGVLGGGVSVAERRRRIAEFSRVQGQLTRLVASVERLASTAAVTGSVPQETAGELARLVQLRGDVGDAMDRLMDGLGGFGA